MYKYIDIHSHINFPDYDSDREDIIAEMKNAGVATITIGTSLETSRSAVELAEQHDNLFACIGIHPHDVHEAFDEFAFEELVKHPKTVAVGECGLDYGKEGVIDEDTKLKQEKLFRDQIAFAVKHDKPVMIHARNSNSDILDILEGLKKEYGEKLRGNAHFFSGRNEEAQRYFDLGFTVSFTGVITFTRDYDEQVKMAPLNKIMSETDAPFVTPTPYRGKRNRPDYVVEVVKKMAEIKGLDEEEVRQAVVDNAVAMFKIV